MIIIISIWQKVVVNVTQLAELLREVTASLFVTFIHLTNIWNVLYMSTGSITSCIHAII